MNWILFAYDDPWIRVSGGILFGARGILTGDP